MTLGERVKKVRKAFDLTQQEFADRIGSKRNTVATYEMGRSVPSAAVVSLICREFDVSGTWLRTGEGEMFTPETLDAWEEVVRKRGLSDKERLILEKFMDLKPAERQAVTNYVLSLAAEYAQLPATVPMQEPPAYPGWKPMTEAEIDQEVAAYRKELELEARAADESAASPKPGA